MRVQLLADHVLRLANGSSIELASGSFIGANAGDYPISQLAGGTIQLTTAMLALDGAATTALGTEQTRMNAVVIPPGQGEASGVPVPQPHKGRTVQADSTKGWAN